MKRAARQSKPAWRRLHDESIVWLLHDHFYHRVDANLAMRRGGVTAKVLLPVADLAVYNDSAGEAWYEWFERRSGAGRRSAKPPIAEDHREFYERTLAQTQGWAVESLVRLERTRALLESRPDRFIVADSARDVLRAKREGKAAVFLGFEGCKALEGRIELLRAFHRLGVRQMQLMWSDPNQLVAVGRIRSWRLSDFGREAVAAMNELGIVVDLSHAPWNLFEDAVERSRDSVIVSHGAPLRAPGGSGDMGREHLDALKACGGLLGLHFCKHYINGPHATFEDFLIAIDYMVEHGYEDVVALGGDLFEDDDYFRARHPAPPGSTHRTWRVFIDELSDISRMPNLTRALVERGYPAATIKKILGGNALRVYRRVLGE